MKPLHTQLLPKKSTASAKKISGYPPQKSSTASAGRTSSRTIWKGSWTNTKTTWKRTISILIPTGVAANAISKSNSDLNSQHESDDVAVIFRATALCQNRFSVSERRIILNFALQNHLPPVSVPSKIEIVATPSERPLPNSLSYFTQENWFWKWFWKTMGEVDLDFKWATSHFPHQISLAMAVVTMKNWSLLPSRNRIIIVTTATVDEICWGKQLIA